MRSRQAEWLFEAALLGWCLFDARRHRTSATVVRDHLTELDAHARERTVELTHANDLRDRFLATVSHELRTPLNAIFGWVHLLKTGTLSPADVERAIDGIDRNARAQARLVSDLLDVSNMMQGRLTLRLASIDIRDVVLRAVEEARAAAARKGIELECECEPIDYPLNGDAARLEQAIANLLSNALRFTARGGRVRVTLRRDDESAYVRISDTGVGIAAADLPHVFDRFVQGTSGPMRVGLGLGLTLVREIVHLHHGDASAESEGVGRGATMTLRFPLSRPIDASAQQPI